MVFAESHLYKAVVTTVVRTIRIETLSKPVSR
jgi:hypothetical protein